MVVFEKGAEVEVCPDDPGFAGSWYEATVIGVPTETKDPKKSSCYYLVEYKTLLAEDAATPLKERVKVNLIRPTPPPEPRLSFQRNDVVDALYLDGWWAGTITKVLENEGQGGDSSATRFEVTFRNPRDVIVFGFSDLRVHLDWKDGKWVQPRLEKNKYRSVGKLDHESAGSVRKGAGLQKLQSKSSESSASSVGSAEGRRHLKKNQLSTGHQKDQLDNPCDNIKSQQNNQTQSRKKSLRKKGGMLGHVLGQNVERKNKFRNVMKMPHFEKNKLLASSDQLGMHSSKKRRAQSADSSVDNGLTNRKRVTVGPKEADNNMTKVGIAVADHRSHGSNASDDQPLSLWLTSACPAAPPVADSGNSTNKNVQELMEYEIATELENVDEAVAATAAVEGNGGNAINSPNQNSEILDQAMEKKDSKVIAHPNHHPEAANETTVAGAAVEGCVIGSNQENMEVAVEVDQAAAAAADGGNVRDANDQNLPFVKTFPFWKEIESMQVFQEMPQRPHFATLLDGFPESCREGMAIGYMVTFCSLVKKTKELRLDCPRSATEECLETLVKLEQNGFDVKVIRDRLTALLVRKDEHNLLQDLLRELENQIKEHNCEKMKSIDETDELDKRIRELQEKSSLALTVKESKEREIAGFISKLESIRQGISSSLIDSEQIATTPL